MRLKHLFFLSFAAMFAASCENKDVSTAPEASRSESNKILSKAEYEKFIKGKLQSAKIAAYTEYGPFTTSAVGSTQVTAGTSNGYYQVAIFAYGFNGALFSKYYRHSYSLTLPAGQYLVPNSITATKVGFESDTPPNPITTTTPNSVSYDFDPVTNTYFLKTYTIVPKFNNIGQDYNPNNVRFPFNEQTTAFIYKYYTL